MAKELSIESPSAPGMVVDRAFVVVQDGAAGPPASTPSVGRAQDHASVARNLQPDETNPAVVLCRHVSFEQTLGGILADIRALAPVIVLTGDAGTGKTMLVRRAMRGLGENAVPVLICDPAATFEDFLGSACRHLCLDESRFPCEVEPEDRFQVFWDYLLAQQGRGRSLVVFADNAQDMSEALLGELALLSKWVNSGKHVLQLVLVGLPGLHSVVRKLVHRELVSEGYPIHSLSPLAPEEVSAFVGLQHTGANGESVQVFLPEAVEKVAAYSHGIPRLILTLCDLAVFKARLEGQSAITPELIDQVAQSDAVDERAQEAEQPEAEEEPQADVQAPPSLTMRATIHHEETQVTRLENLNKILKNLQSESPGIEASALISEDGLMIASALSADLDDTRVGGMTATLLSLGTRAAAELHRGEVKEVIVRGEEGYAVMVSAGRGTLLLVLANESTKLGLIFFDMREAVKSIGKVL